MFQAQRQKLAPQVTFYLGMGEPGFTFPSREKKRPVDVIQQIGSSGETHPRQYPTTLGRPTKAGRFPADYNPLTPFADPFEIELRLKMERRPGEY